MAILRSLNASTFAASYNGYCEVEIGDVTKAYFSPHIKVKKWGEVSGGLQFPTLKQIAAIEQSSKQLTWASPSEQVQLAFDIVDPGSQWEDGAIELHITLLKKPPTNKISFPFVCENLEICGPVPLVMPQREIDKGLYWLDNVRGSYSFYHKTRGNFNQPHLELGNIYKTGKAFHLYRVDAHDSVGKTIWCEMVIANDVLTLSLPQAWLDAAQYPVSIGETTFGYTSLGAEFGSTSNQSVWWALDANSPASGTITNLSIGVPAATYYGDAVQFGLYSDNGGVPDARLTYDSSTFNMPSGAQSAQFITNPVAWSYALSGAVQLWGSSHANYWATPGGEFVYDTGGSKANRYNANTSPPASAGSTTQDYTNAHFSVYATYTAGGGPSIIPLVMHNRRQLGG